MAKHWAAFNRTADGSIDGDTVSIHTGEIKAMWQALTQGGDYKEIEIGLNIGDDPTPAGPLPGQDPIPVEESVISIDETPISDGDAAAEAQAVAEVQTVKREPVRKAARTDASYEDALKRGADLHESLIRGMWVELGEPSEEAFVMVSEVQSITAFQPRSKHERRLADDGYVTMIGFRSGSAIATKDPNRRALFERVCQEQVNVARANAPAVRDWP